MPHLSDEKLNEQIAKRRTFAIISHPDAGKTTLTEKLLFAGGAIAVAGSVKARKASRHATSDWMALEKQRGISVTTSVMQIPYRDHMINLLDTPGHADFSEDTYRTLTAVDSALMVIDSAKGVEARTIKLMDVCRLRDTPILTFINKLDRESINAIELLDNIESVLNIQCTPMTWPIGMGAQFKGVVSLHDGRVHLYQKGKAIEHFNCIDDPALDAHIDSYLRAEFKEELSLIQEAYAPLNRDDYLCGKQTPVYFGTALNDFGVKDILNALVDYAPPPKARQTTTRDVMPCEKQFSAFVFKIQANMDPKHHDRMAFLRITSGDFFKGIKLKQVRIKKSLAVHDALTFMAGNREHTDSAVAGDIIGLHNHGSIRIGDTFTEGEDLKFIGIPNFAPELFREVILDDPLKQKSLLKGLIQLSEEGATQYFKPLLGSQLILGAVGILQFDVVAHRLAHEYSVKCHYQPASVVAARWISSENAQKLADFKTQEQRHLAHDGHDQLIYLAPSRVNLQLTIERWPELQFSDIQEHQT